MKNYSKFRRLILTMFVAAAVFGPASKSFAQNAPAEWTLMFYMDSDNNLEAAQMMDLAEMMVVGSSANVNIVVLCDRSAKGDDEDGYTNYPVGNLKNWTTAKMLRVEKGGLREVAD